MPKPTKTQGRTNTGGKRPNSGRKPGDRLSREHAILSNEEAMDEIFDQADLSLPPKARAFAGGKSHIVKVAGRNLPNPADPQSALSHFTVLEQWYLRLLAKGRSRLQAGRFLKLTPAEITAVNQNPAVDEAIAELVEQEINNIVGMMAPLIPKAIQTLARAMDTDEPGPTAVKAADSILDRALGKAPLMERKEIKQALLIQIQHLDAPNPD